MAAAAYASLFVRKLLAGGMSALTTGRKTAGVGGGTTGEEFLFFVVHV